MQRDAENQVNECKHHPVASEDMLWRDKTFHDPNFFREIAPGQMLPP